MILNPTIIRLYSDFPPQQRLKFSLSFLSFLVCRSSEVPFQFATLLNHCLHFSRKTLPCNLESMRPPYIGLYSLPGKAAQSINLEIEKERRSQQTSKLQRSHGLLPAYHQHPELSMRQLSHIKTHSCELQRWLVPGSSSLCLRGLSLQEHPLVSILFNGEGRTCFYIPILLKRP